MVIREKSPYVLSKGAYSVAALSRKTTIIKNFLSSVESGYITEPFHDGFFKINIRKEDDRPNRYWGPKEVIQLLDYLRENQPPDGRLFIS